VIQLQEQLKMSPNPIDKQEIAQQIKAARLGQKTPWQKTLESWTLWDYTDFMTTKNPAAILAVQKANAADLVKMGQLQAQLRVTPKSESFEIMQEIQAIATKIQQNVGEQSTSMKRQEDFATQQARARMARAKEASERSGESQKSLSEARTKQAARLADKAKLEKEKFEVWKKDMAAKAKTSAIREMVRDAKLQIAQERLNLAVEKGKSGPIEKQQKALTATIDKQIGDILKNEMAPAVAAFEKAHDEFDRRRREIWKYAGRGEDEEVYTKTGRMTVGEYRAGLTHERDTIDEQLVGHRELVESLKKQIADKRASDPNYKPPATPESAVAKSEDTRNRNKAAVATTADSEFPNLTVEGLRLEIIQIHRAADKALTPEQVKAELTKRYGSAWKKFAK